METADVVIVGAGIVGSATAYFLGADPAIGGQRVVLIEGDPSYGQASTARSAGGLRQQFSTPENVAMSQVTLSLFRGLQGLFGADADVSFREQGYLILATGAGERMLAENVVVQRSMGANVVLLGVPELSQGFPWLTTDDIAAGAFGETGEGWFDPPSFAALLRKAAVANGIELLHERVTGIDIAEGAVNCVRLASGASIACGSLVNAAGPWAGELAGLAGLQLPVAPRKRYVYVLDCRDAPVSLHQAPLTVDISGVWFRPEGRVFLCGRSPAEHEEPAPEDLDNVDHDFFEREIWPALAARVPAFEAVKVTNAWAGYYDYNSFDQNAVIGPHPEVRNFYFANGFSGHGAQQGAAAGRAISELIVHGQFQTIDLTRLGYERIRDGIPLRERNVI